MDASQAEKAIKNAWIAGVISGIVTLVVTAIAMAGYSFLGFSAWNLLDAALIFGLAFGISRKSRICSVVMLVYFVGSKIFLWMETGSLSGLPLAIIFGYYFFMGMLGTFAVDREAAAVRTAAVAAPAVPKFKTKEEYQQWKEDRLNFPQQTAPVAAAPVRTGTAGGSSIGWVLALVVSIAAAVFLFMTDTGSEMMDRIMSLGKPQWAEYTSTEGNFSVWFPGSPSQETKQVGTAAGPLAMHTFSRELSGKTAYVVAYSDYPEFITRVPPDKVLDGGRDGALANSRGTLLSEEPVYMPGISAGREIRINAAEKGVHLKMRAYLVQQRLYQVMAIAPPETIDSEESSKFFASFKLLKP